MMCFDKEVNYLLMAVIFGLASPKKINGTKGFVKNLPFLFGDCFMSLRKTNGKWIIPFFLKIKKFRIQFKISSEKDLI